MAEYQDEYVCLVERRRGREGGGVAFFFYCTIPRYHIDRDKMPMIIISRKKSLCRCPNRQDSVVDGISPSIRRKR